MTEHKWKQDQGEPDEFALDVEAETTGHNGPECETCGFSACISCVRAKKKDIYNPEQFPCPGPPPEGKTWYFHDGSDPSSIPEGTY